MSTNTPTSHRHPLLPVRTHGLLHRTFMANSSTRSPAQTGWVWPSTRPGRSTPPAASTTVSKLDSGYAASTDSLEPTAAIRPSLLRPGRSGQAQMMVNRPTRGRWVCCPTTTACEDWLVCGLDSLDGRKFLFCLLGLVIFPLFCQITPLKDNGISQMGE